MRMLYLGDSYDIVKQSLIRWLGSFGDWTVHPMFTEPVPPGQVAAFAILLGAKVISTNILTLDTDRTAYLSCPSSCGNLFLDPDTGLRLRETRGVRAPEYLFAAELIRLTEQRRESLTMVFDQSVGRGKERPHLERKLRHLMQEKVFGFAYVSHACFVIASRDQSLVDRARKRIIEESKLPESRFLTLDAA